MTRKKRGVSRRHFLRRSAIMSLGTVAAGAAPVVATAQSAPATTTTTTTEPAPTPPHGAELRGMSLPMKDRSAEGRFGVMFKRLPGFVPTDDLLIGL